MHYYWNVLPGHPGFVSYLWKRHPPPLQPGSASGGRHAECNKFCLKTTSTLCQSGLRLWWNAFRGKTESFVIPPLKSRLGFSFMAEREAKPPSTHSGHLHNSTTLGPLSDDVSHFSSAGSCWTAATMTHIVSGDEGSYLLCKSPDCSKNWCRGSVQLWVFLSL